MGGKDLCDRYNARAEDLSLDYCIGRSRPQLLIVAEEVQDQRRRVRQGESNICVFGFVVANRVCRGEPRDRARARTLSAPQVHLDKCTSTSAPRQIPQTQLDLHRH